MATNPAEAVTEPLYTRRQYLLMRALNNGANWEASVTAVNIALRTHPEWNTDEMRTYAQWEEVRGR